MKERDLAVHIAQLLDARKAIDIQVLRVEHLTVITDYMVLATGNTQVQTKALMEHVDQNLSQRGLSPRRVEGASEGRWIVMDYESVLVHIFHPEDRSFYRLERLWSDGQNRLLLPFEMEEVQKEDQEEAGANRA